MKARLRDDFVRAASAQLARSGLDGWLLYDLKARNGVAADLLGLSEGLSRRYFVLLRPDAPPSALAHRIELAYWDAWPHGLQGYVGWEEMEGALARLLQGCRKVAMEVSPGDAVPILDTVPAGVVELVEACGVEVVTSAPLIAGTLAQWGARGRRLHREAAAILRETARTAYGLAARAATGGDGPAASAGEGPREGGPDLPATEHDLAAWIRGELGRRGLTDVDTIVAVGANSALPHYEPPPDGSARLERGKVLLIDLWGRMAGDPEAVVADQTWMGFLGEELPEEVAEAWDAVREARDAAVELLRRAGDDLPTGAEVDRRVRALLSRRGFGDAILHRTGHGIDRQTHGFGPNLDSVETRDERLLVRGIGFSVEPGLYFEGRFGLRSEINVHLGEAGPEVSPPEPQETPWLLDG